MDVKRICELLGEDQESLEKIGTGYRNDAYLLNEKYVLRSDSEHLKHEYELLEKYDVGFTAHLYDEQTNTLVTEFIDAKHPQEYDEDVIVQLTRFINRLQNIEPDESPNSHTWIHEYVQDHELSDKAMAIYELFKQLPERNADTIIHNDLGLSNILLTEPITVIDWEHWEVSYKERELAALSFKLHKNQQLMQVVFEHYEHELDVQAYKDAWIFEAMKHMCLLHHWLRKDRVIERVGKENLQKRQTIVTDWAYSVLFDNDDFFDINR